MKVLPMQRGILPLECPMRFFFSLLLILLTLPALSTEPVPLDLPWTVFSDGAPVVAEPKRGAPIVETLSKGRTLAGKLSVDPATEDEWLAFQIGERKLYISRVHLTRPHPANKVEGDLPIGQEIVNRWWGIPLEYVPSDLVDVPARFSRGKDTYRLRKEPCEALVAMFEAAEKANVPLRVASAYRSGETQVRIYQRNTLRDLSQRSSAPPGHSEHQLGTTVDLADAEGKHVISGSFERTPQSHWLEANAVDFGFVRSYYPDNREETGYITEPWHWRYVGKDLARKKVAERQERLALQTAK